MIRRRPVNRYNSDGLADSNRQQPGERRSPNNTPNQSVTVDANNPTVEIDTPLGGVRVTNDPTIQHPYLVPLGIPGMYQSPVEPVDPTDCERWPSSPYCSGSPAGFDPRSRTGLGLDVDVNPCEICVTIAPSLSYISLPPLVYCYRQPECRPNDTPTPDSEVPLGGTKPVPITGGVGFCEGQRYIFALQGGFDSWDAAGLYNEFPEYGSTYEVSGSLYGRVTGAKLWKHPLLSDRREDGSGYDAWMMQIDCQGNYHNDYSLVPYNQARVVPVQTHTYNAYVMRVPQKSGSISVTLHLARPDGALEDDCCTDDNPCERPPIIAPPPYPPPCIPCDDMACCNSESEELLRLIAKRLGTDQFPAKVPTTLSAEDGNGTTQIQSLTELFGWYVKQFDALVGQFPIEIKFDDVDPLKEGDQKKTLKLPNIAETLAELMGVVTLTSINSNTLVDGMVRNLIEANAAKTYALKGQYLAQAIADYLSFDIKEVRTPVPCSFTPGKTEFDDLLRESDQKVELTHYDDQRDFEDELKELLAAAAIIKAVHYRKYRGSQDLTDQVKNRFKELINLAEKGSPNPSDSGDDSRSDFDTFVEDVESGFANTAGVSDTLNPYGKPYGQRPKIRELGNTSDQTDARNL